MNKQNRGDAPKPEKTSFKDYDPLHGTKPMGGFDQDNIASGDLRQHNGCHYTGDHEPKGPGSAITRGKT